MSRSGSWYSFGDQRLGQGIGNSAVALEEEPKLADQLETAIREKAGLNKNEAAAPKAEQDAGETDAEE